MNELLRQFHRLTNEEYVQIISLSEAPATTALNEEFFSLVIELLTRYTGPKYAGDFIQRKTIYSIAMNTAEFSPEFNREVVKNKILLDALMKDLSKCSKGETEENHICSYLIVAIFYNISNIEEAELRDKLIELNLHRFEYKAVEKYPISTTVIPLLILIKINLSVNKYPLFIDPLITYFERIIPLFNKFNEFIVEGLSVNEIFKGLKNVLTNSTFEDEMAHKKIVEYSISLLSRLPIKSKSVEIVTEYLKAVTIHDDCKKTVLKALDNHASENCNEIRKFLSPKPEQDQGTTQKEDSSNNPGYDIMISYTHRDKEIVNRVTGDLEKEGYCVWKDDKNMSGCDDLLDSMSEAVERAKLILIFYSADYQKSLHTKAEAQYAYKLKKDIIYVRVERNFNPTGWLGIMLSTRMYVDVTGKYPYEDKIKELKETIKEKLVQDTSKTPNKPSAKPEPKGDIYKPSPKLLLQKGLSQQNNRAFRLQADLARSSIDPSNPKWQLIAQLRFTDKAAYLDYVVNNFSPDDATGILKLVAHFAGSILAEEQDSFKFEGY